MREYLEILIYFSFAYILTFLLYLFVFNKKGKKKKEESLEVMYMVNRFKLHKDKINMKRIKWILNFINPLIISVTFVAVMMIDSFALGLMVGFVIMLALIYSVYEIIGRILKRREEKCKTQER